MLLTFYCKFVCKIGNLKVKDRPSFEKPVNHYSVQQLLSMFRSMREMLLQTKTKTKTTQKDKDKDNDKNKDNHNDKNKDNHKTITEVTQRRK